jgi:hypothetical protein
MILMEYSGAQGTLIHEKKLKSKISCQTPFNVRLKMSFVNTVLKHEAILDLLEY